MGYRDDTEALRAQIEGLQGDLQSEKARADQAEREVARVVAGEPSVATLPQDTHWVISQVMLYLTVAGHLVFLLVSVPLYIMIAHDEPPFGYELDRTIQGLLMAGIVNLFFLPISLTAGAGLVGMRRRQRWGWFAAIASFGMSTMCACVPVGIYGLWALLRAPVREAFFPPRRPPNAPG